VLASKRQRILWKISGRHWNGKRRGRGGGKTAVSAVFPLFLTSLKRIQGLLEVARKRDRLYN
jgi:hypothetical protein